MEIGASKQNILDKIFYFNKNDCFVKLNRDCESIEKARWIAVFEEVTSPFEFIVTENHQYLPEYGNDIVVILKSN